MHNKKTIQLSDFHPPISLDNVIINIAHQKPVLPVEVEERVKENWNNFRKSRPDATDNDAAYLVSYNSGSHGVYAEAFTAGFSYNQYFNRDDKEMVDTEVANAHNFNPLASWIIAVSKDGHALFGNKKDFGNKKVSGFGGFTTRSDLHDGQLDMTAHITRKLEEELGLELTKAVEEISSIGLNYYPLVGPKGFDGVYIVKLDGKAKDLEKIFEGNAQFSKQMIPVKSNPKELVTFLNSSDWQPTRSCVGGVMTYIAARYGEQQLANSLAQYSGAEKITVSNLHPQRPLIGK